MTKKESKTRSTIPGNLPGAEMVWNGKAGIDQWVWSEQPVDKADQGKLRWDLLDFDHIQDIVHILTLGANKYSDNGWQTVENPRERYFAALMRHISAWRTAERLTGDHLDSESGLSHLAHAACCLMILHWWEDRDDGESSG